jgi:acyl carrier protein
MLSANAKSDMGAILTDRITTVFADVLDVAAESLNDESSPDNTSNWDSVAAMSLVAAIEDAFGVEFSTKEIVSMRTIGLVRTVLRRKGVADV